MGSKGEANLQTANTQARVEFEEVLNTWQPGVLSLLAEEYSTGSDRDSLVFGTGLNTIREWLGPREWGSMEWFAQSVVLTTFEDTVDLPRKLVDYDTTGAVAKSLASKFREALSNGDDKILFDTLISASGAGPTAFDGIALISASHSLGGVTYSNTTTSAMSFATLDGGIQAMQGFKTAAGEPLNIFPTHLVCGPKLRKLALDFAANARRVKGIKASGEEGTTSNVAAAAIENVFAGDNINVIISNRFTGTYDDYWYLADLSKPSKPLMLKNERQWEMHAKTSMTDEKRFNQDRYEWGIECDKKVAAGAWPCIYGGIVA